MRPEIRIVDGEIFPNDERVAVLLSAAPSKHDHCLDCGDDCCPGADINNWPAGSRLAEVALESILKAISGKVELDGWAGAARLVP